MKKAALVIIPVLIIALGGGFFIFKGKQPVQAPAEPTPTVEMIPIEKLEEKNPYGIELTPRFDKKAVFLKISSFPEGLKTIEYELTYETKDGPRGVIGSPIDYKGEESLKREILLGTCSKNVCRYDEGVKEILLTVVFRGEKVEKFQGKFSLK